MRITIPKLRTWHLLGIVAASAAFFSVMQFRWSVEDPGYDLVRRLRSLDASERSKAADESRSFRPRERRAIAPLTEMLFDSDARARASAAQALLHIVDSKDEMEFGQVKAALASALGDRDPVARLQIARTLGYLRPEPKVVVPTLLEFARGPDAKARSEAISILGQFGRQSEPARAALFAALVDSDIQVRTWAIDSLGYCSWRPDLAPEPFRGQIKSALIGAADDEDPRVRATAVRALGTLASQAESEIPRVIEALGDPSPWVRCAAANYLCWNRLGKRSETLLPALVRTLADPDAQVRLMTIRTLGTLGIDAEAAISPLRTLANDSAETIREAATRAIEAIEKAALDFRTITLPEAIAELGDADPIVRSLAASRLEEIGPGAAEAVPALVRCLADREADVRQSAARALGQLGPGAAVAVPTLANMAESDVDERVRQAANLSRSILSRDEGGANRSP